MINFLLSNIAKPKWIIVITLITTIIGIITVQYVIIKKHDSILSKIKAELSIAYNQVEHWKKQQSQCAAVLDNQTAALELLQINVNSIIAEYNKEILETHNELKIVRNRLDVNNTCEERLKIILEQQQMLFTVLQLTFQGENTP